MNVEQICWLRETLVTNAEGQDKVGMDISYETGLGRTPHFFTVPQEDLIEARALYKCVGIGPSLQRRLEDGDGGH
jgi:hypothetical protein